MNRSVSALLLAVLVVGSASANPVFTPGVWTDITPPGKTRGDLESCLGLGIAISPANPSTIYWCNNTYDPNNGGLFRSTTGGSTWARIAKVVPAWNGASAYLDEPLHVRIDPDNPNHMYACDGVRGSSNGFFVSLDGGDSFYMPQGFLDVLDSAAIDNRDIYDVAVDPTDFNHVLISFHYRWGWTETKWNTNSGVLESKDGGSHWRVIVPINGWGSGHAINFLYSPSLGIGNSDTWLLGTQNDGFWRTTNSGASWTKVSNTSITHGGGTVYYTADGTLYASGSESTMRSTNNGASWTSVGPTGTWCVWGDGTTLYTGKSFVQNQNILVSPESNGTAWTNFNSQVIADGPYSMAFDKVNGIMYSSNWSWGVWALKVAGSTKMAQSPALTSRSKTIASKVTVLKVLGNDISGAGNFGSVYDLTGRLMNSVVDRAGITKGISIVTIK